MINNLQLETLSKVELGANYLKLPPETSDRDIGPIFDALNNMAGASLWWIGDLLNYLEERKGEHYTKDFENNAYDPGTLRVAKFVCRRFPVESRLKVSYTHHRESLIEAKRDGITDINLALRFLKAAEESGLTVKEMRKEMRLAIKASLPAPVPADDFFNVEYILAREAVFTLQRYLERIDSTTNEIAKASILGEIETLWEFAVKVCKLKGNN